METFRFLDYTVEYNIKEDSMYRHRLLKDNVVLVTFRSFKEMPIDDIIHIIMYDGISSFKREMYK